MCSSPDVIEKRSGGTTVRVTKLAPWGRLHIEQWQCPQNNVGNSISNFTAPQKQLPGTVKGVMVRLQVSCLFRIFIVDDFNPHVLCAYGAARPVKARELLAPVYVWFRTTSARGRFDVLVQPEQVGWIIFVLERNKPLVLIGSVRILDSRGAFIAFLSYVVHIDAARRIGLHGIP